MSATWPLLSNVIHNVLHKHRVLSRGLEEMIICEQRWPWGSAYVMYRPHVHSEWTKMSIEEFQDKLRSEGPKWNQTNYP